MGDMFSLETPESVAVGYSIAGVGSRFMAAMIDTLIQAAVMLATFVVMVVARVNLSGASGYTIAALGTLFFTIVFLGYYIFFELIWNGQSPGKRILKLRVISINGYPETPFAALIRNVLRLVDVLPSLYAIGVISMIVTKRSRRLGDLAAGTMVIKEGREGTLASLPTAAPAIPRPDYYVPVLGAARPAGLILDGGTDVTQLTRQDAALIRDFLSRRATLPPARRESLSRQIADVVNSHIGGEQHYTPETYLELVLSAHDDTNR